MPLGVPHPAPLCTLMHLWDGFEIIGRTQDEFKTNCCFECIVQFLQYDSPGINITFEVAELQQTYESESRESLLDQVPCVISVVLKYSHQLTFLNGGTNSRFAMEPLQSLQNRHQQFFIFYYIIYMFLIKTN